MRVAVGISGGVDSAVAALLLAERGYELAGVTMTLGRDGDDEMLEAAHSVAARLGIGLEVFDFSREWKEGVLGYVRAAGLAGLTPNPCVKCNELVKLSLLPRAAFKAGADFFATGHYARIEGGRIMRGIEKPKDQSYFLYRVPADVLSRLLLPLGAMTKAQVRDKAREAGFEVADRRDSQDFCGGDVPSLICAEEREGDIVDTGGRVLGRHRGFWNYTVGKRKGLGIGGGIPYYVIRLDAARNEVVVGFKEEVAAGVFALEGYVGEAVSPDRELAVKVRSAGEPRGPAFLDGGKVVCPEGMSAVAPGQSAVFYDGDVLVGGGIISAAKVTMRCRGVQE
jgi:tRNA-specific 2-thiouridylase